MMEIRMALPQEYSQLAEMKWLHCEEDDRDYGEHTLHGVAKEEFAREFISFLNAHPEYKVFVACDSDMVVSAMFVYVIPKVPKPNRMSKSIAYLTNVYTRKEYRNQKIGTQLLSHIKEYLTKEQCELIFVWPSERSSDWYARNGFCAENEIFEYALMKE